MNTQTIVSILLKAGLLASGALLALGMITPDQQAQLNEALNGVAGGVANLAVAALTIYQIVRSIRTHKDK